MDFPLSTNNRGVIMNIAAVIMCSFALLGALDRIFGNKFGLGAAFERGFEMLGTLALSMLGMIIISPFLADLMNPLLQSLPDFIDPSIITSSIFANDMGGAPLTVEVARDAEIGLFNALITGAMMGCTVSFTIPYALSAVKKERQKDVLLGLLCGIVTIPVGCLAGGMAYGISLTKLIINLLPLLLFSAIIALGLIFVPNLCVKIFTGIGYLIKALITVGLAVGIVHLLTGYTPIENITPLMEAGEIVINAAVVMSGAFPLLHIISKLLSKPLKRLSEAKHIPPTSIMGILSSLATSATTFCDIKNMDSKGAIINSAFAVSGAFLLTDHLAFTLSFEESYLPAVLIGKAIAALFAVGVAFLLTNRKKNEA
ncbi:MAG: ethanolamine utilization protein EutH [Clostridia bacterium]|nr:ethanolamine utilization protein EutH [Clostridia bacterium]